MMSDCYFERRDGTRSFARWRTDPDAIRHR
jgi:hypothetical protein